MRYAFFVLCYLDFLVKEASSTLVDHIPDNHLPLQVDTVPGEVREDQFPDMARITKTPSDGSQIGVTVENEFYRVKLYANNASISQRPDGLLMLNAGLNDYVTFECRPTVSRNNGKHDLSVVIKASNVFRVSDRNTIEGIPDIVQHRFQVSPIYRSPNHEVYHFELDPRRKSVFDLKRKYVNRPTQPKAIVDVNAGVVETLVLQKPSRDIPTGVTTLLGTYYYSANVGNEPKYFPVSFLLQIIPNEK